MLLSHSIVHFIKKPGSEYARQSILTLHELEVNTYHHLINLIQVDDA